jgi:DNA-binding response OmpR family regulator
VSGLICPVDHEPTVRDLLGCVLEHAGYRVRSIDTSTKAAAALREQPTDLALVDISLSGGVASSSAPAKR